MYLTIQWLQLHFSILCISLHLGCDPHVRKNSGKKEKNASIPINQMYGIDYMEKVITWHTFKTSKNGDIQWIWSGGWEWWAVSGIIGRWSWFYLHIYAAKYVYFWILQRRLARHWGAGIIHVSSRRGYMKKNFTNRTMHGWYRIQRQAISENNSGFESQKGLSNHPPTL